VPGLGKPRVRPGIWGPIARTVTRRPLAWLITAVCLLGALAVPAVDLELAETSIATGLPKELPAAQAHAAIERAFPGAPADAELVVTAQGLDDPAARERLEALGVRAMEVTGGRGQVGVEVARDGATARVAVPMPDRGQQAAEETVRELRDAVAPTAASVVPGAQALVTGDAAGSADFTDRLAGRTPLVVGFVLLLAFALVVAAFRSVKLAASVMALNLLSAGATFGVLAAVFQHTWAEGLLDFESTGTVVSWIPLFAFVILFGLSMDYTILVLERMREARRAGRSAREAAAEGVAATGAAVTSAAVVMVAVFAVFAMLRMPEMKQMGVGLAAAILIDATIVRGVALPAVVALLGDRGWRVRRARRSWDDRRTMTAAGSPTTPVAHEG
jgi:RND superfamily putative drug exporter